MAYKSKKTLPRKKHYTKTKADKERDKEAVRVMLGGEPDDHEIEKLDQPVRYLLALDWYRQTCGYDEARTFLEDFLTDAKSKHLDAIRKVPDQWLNPTACWIARLMSRGAVLPPSSMPFFKKALVSMVDKAGAEVLAPTDADGNPIEKPKQEKATVQENIRGRASDLVAEIQGLIDDGVATNGWSAYQWLSSQQVSSKVASVIVERFRPILNELLEVANKTDAQLMEGYRHLTSKQLKLLIDFYQALIDDTNKFAAVNKKAKAPRKARTVSVEKKLKHFKYMKQSDEYKIASISPAQILEANELWTFNTSSRILTVYRTTAGDKLGIHRTAITQFEPKMSEAKRIGRNTADTLKYVLETGKIGLRKVMEGISSGPAPFSDRIHDKIILLRVVK